MMRDGEEGTKIQNILKMMKSQGLVTNENYQIEFPGFCLGPLVVW